MDGSGYASGYGREGWAFGGGGPGYMPMIPAAAQVTPYGIAYSGPAPALMVPLAQGAPRAAQYDAIAQYGTPGYGYPLGAYQHGADGSELYDDTWYQGFYRGYEGEHGEEYVEHSAELYDESLPDDGQEGDGEEEDGEEAEYDTELAEQDLEDGAHTEAVGIAPVPVERKRAPLEIRVPAAAKPPLASAAGETPSAGPAAAAGKMPTQRLNPSAPTFLNPGAKAFVPPAKAATSGSGAGAGAVSDATSAAMAAPRGPAAADVFGSTGASPEPGQEQPQARGAADPAEPSTSEDPGQAPAVDAAEAARAASSSASSPSLSTATGAVAAPADEGGQPVKRALIAAGAPLSPSAATSSGSRLPIPIPMKPASATAGRQEVSAAETAGAEEAETEERQTAAQADAAAGVLANDDKTAATLGEKLAAEAALAEGSSKAEEAASSSSSSSTTTNTTNTTTKLSMSDLPPLASPFRCFVTGLFSLFQGTRGEYGMDCLWWCLDTLQQQQQQQEEEEEMSGAELQEGGDAAVGNDGAVRVAASPVSPSPPCSPAGLRQPQTAPPPPPPPPPPPRVLGPFSCELMILAYIAQALPADLPVCGTAGANLPPCPPPVDAFQPVGALLDAADAGQTYIPLKLPPRS